MRAHADLPSPGTVVLCVSPYRWLARTVAYRLAQCLVSMSGLSGLAGHQAVQADLLVARARWWRTEAEAGWPALTEHCRRSCQ